MFSRELTGYNKPEVAYDWARAQKVAEQVAQKFGVTLPRGWNEPPVHHTAFNCWQCGEFAPGTHITKKDLSLGWFDFGAEGVFCSATHHNLYQVAQSKAAPPKANGHVRDFGKALKRAAASKGKRAATASKAASKKKKADKRR